MEETAHPRIPVGADLSWIGFTGPIHPIGGVRKRQVYIELVRTCKSFKIVES